MVWQIEVDLGVGPLKFGMKSSEVAFVLDAYGKVKIRSTEADGSVFEYRSHHIPICYYKDDMLWHISLRSEVGEAEIGGVSLFSENSKSVLQALLVLSGDIKSYEEMIIFYSLGITTRGYLDLSSYRYADVNSNRDARAVGISEVDALRATLQSHKEIILP